MPGNSKTIHHGERKGLNTDSAEQARYFERIEAREATDKPSLLQPMGILM